MLGLDEIKVKIVGEQPLIMHRGDLADPMDKYSKLISAQSKKAKKAKTEEEYEELYRREWYGSLYLDDKIGIVIPTDNAIKMVIEGARRSKLGKQVEAAVFAVGIEPDGHHEAIKLDYPGPQDPDEMWTWSMAGKMDFVFKKTIRVGQSRVVRCRPIFRTWGFTFILRYDKGVIEKEALMTAMEAAGNMLGLGDWRPRYGTFSVHELN
jgi:hypothetical protein